MPFEDFAQRHAELTRWIAEACERSHRDPCDVSLIAVTKGHPIEAMQTALANGIHDLGESRVQDALPKLEYIDDSARVHFIGRLQTNKVNKVVGAFESIMAVDRLDLLERIARRAQELEIVQKIWIQVNASGEEQKGGCFPEAASELASRAGAEASLEVIGVMGMGRANASESELRSSFRELRELRDRLADDLDSSLHLSMGMSADFAVAVEEGATHIRVGTGLFGVRPSY